MVTVNDLTAIADADHIVLTSFDLRTRYAEIYCDRGWMNDDNMIDKFRHFLPCKVITFCADGDEMTVAIDIETRCGE